MNNVLFVRSSFAAFVGLLASIEQAEGEGDGDGEMEDCFSGNFIFRPSFSSSSREIRKIRVFRQRIGAHVLWQNISCRTLIMKGIIYFLADRAGTKYEIQLAKHVTNSPSAYKRSQNNFAR